MHLCTFSPTAFKYLTVLVTRSITIFHTSENMYLNVCDKWKVYVLLYGILR